MPHSQPAMMTLGADGNVWFTQPQADKIGRITPDGYVTEFPLPAAGVPLGIASGVDKNLWVTVIRAQVIYRVTPNGEFTAFPMPANSMATFITAAPDGTLWFTEPNGKVGRLTTDGVRQGICLLESVQRTRRKQRCGRGVTRRWCSSATGARDTCSVRQVLRYKRSITRTKTLGAFGFRHYAAREN